MTAPSRTITQPIGTSPAATAARACSSASSMKDTTPPRLLSGAPLSMSSAKPRKRDRHSHRKGKDGERGSVGLPLPGGERVGVRGFGAAGRPQAPSSGSLRDPTSPLRGEVKERVAKVIARAGLASRREAETWIAAGRVAVNGAIITSPALNVGAGDRVSVDGKLLPVRERTRLFLYHK